MAYNNENGCYSIAFSCMYKMPRALLNNGACFRVNAYQNLNVLPACRCKKEWEIILKIWGRELLEHFGLDSKKVFGRIFTYCPFSLVDRRGWREEVGEMGGRVGIEWAVLDGGDSVVDGSKLGTVQSGLGRNVEGELMDEDKRTGIITLFGSSNLGN